MSYKVRNIPDRFLKVLDDMWGAMVTLPEGQTMIPGGVAIDSFSYEVASDSKERIATSGEVSLASGAIRRTGSIYVAIVGTKQ